MEKAERLRDDLRSKGWIVNSDDNSNDQIVVNRNDFLALRDWLRDHPNQPDDEFLVYIADQTHLIAGDDIKISFSTGEANIVDEIDYEFKDHLCVEFTLVFGGPKSGGAIHDQTHLGPKCLVICSMHESEDYNDDLFDLQYSLMGDNFLEAGRQERARLLLENPVQHVQLKNRNNPVP
ncbi:MAG: hypothetical protein ACMUIG_04645 [Thermoplasmatota archaeon]